LPGGKAEEGDKDDGDTATREAMEEIGLDPSLVNVVTVLEPFLSKVLYYHLFICLVTMICLCNIFEFCKNQCLIFQCWKL
jgi:8-oxo-dGTP pyrophosphatase MutT (NUDIX family)